MAALGDRTLVPLINCNQLLGGVILVLRRKGEDDAKVANVAKFEKAVMHVTN